MTSSTSAVAVCCSSDSLSSSVRCCSALNRRTFSIAIAAWSAKVCQKGNVLLLERPHLGSADQDRAECATLADQRHGKDAAMPELDRQFSPESEFFAGAVQIGDMDRLQIANGASRDSRAIQLHCAAAVQGRRTRRRHAACRSRQERYRLFVPRRYGRRVRRPNKHRLHVTRRIRYHAQDLADCSLLLQRLGEIVGALLNVLEQP